MNHIDFSASHVPDNATNIRNLKREAVKIGSQLGAKTTSV